MLTREECDAALLGPPPPDELTPDDIRALVDARHEETLRERISAAMWLDLVTVQNYGPGEPTPAPEARWQLWNDVTGAMLADEAAHLFELGDAS
jgi:hypothetical protein